MTTKAKAKAAAAETKPTAVVYCGPRIQGIAAQYQVFIGGLPEQLTVAIEKRPVLGALIVPLAEMAEARKAINSGTGRLAALFQKAKEV